MPGPDQPRERAKKPNSDKVIRNLRCSNEQKIKRDNYILIEHNLAA